ncbi:hypothetical protein N9051_02755 [Akkermansiaceae bacterium]|nr:hypothetical protein [Akkermansiaceae bacterium]
MPKKPPIRKLRILLNVVIIVLLTLLGRSFYDQWDDRRAAEQVVSLAHLPELPEELEVLHATEDESGMTLSVLAGGDDSEVFDQWMVKVDEWKKKQPLEVLNFSVRESEKSLRVDFSIELRPSTQVGHY